MSNSPHLPNELGLLRVITRNLVCKPHEQGPISEDTLRAHGFARAKMGPQGLFGILQPASESFQQFSESVFARHPAIERGTSFPEFQKELFGVVLKQCLERDAEDIAAVDVDKIAAEICRWFAARVAHRQIFVACVISPWHSPEFFIGPIRFTHLEDVVAGKTSLASRADLASEDLARLLKTMREERAHWLATIKIDGCDADRAIELGNLAVDLAIVGLHLAAPYLGTKNMSRLDTRKGTGQVDTLQLSNGFFSVGWSNVEPGLSIGTGYLAKEIIEKASPLISAVGNCVNSFATGLYRLPLLEQAWCDAAYWLHQGLAESLDTIAVAKLETAIEVLFKAESTSGSERRTLLAFETFFGLKPDDSIFKNSQITAKQFAKTLVRDRSRILHGTWSTLGTRLGASRDMLEYIATTVVRACAVEFEGYLQTSSPVDAIEPFLDWVREKRQKRIAAAENPS